MEILCEVILDAGLDSLKILPFLFAAFLMIEALEHYSGDWTQKALVKVGKAGPVVGAAAGLVPQCGFSVLAANLYAGGVVSAGTLLAVFLATSDEAVLIIMGNPGKMKEIGILLAVKFVIAVIAGYVADFLFFKRRKEGKRVENAVHESCGCQEERGGIVKHAWAHTVKIWGYLFLFTLALNLVIEVVGMEKVSVFLLRDTMLQPVAAALVGLVPNCAASVILTQLYLNGVVSFASVISGLCTSAGAGLIVLFKMNHCKKENMKLLIYLVFVAVTAGMLLEIFL